MILASIQKINNIIEHPNADSLLKAKVLEWPVVIKKNEYNNGDLIVFIFPDVIVDKDNPYFEFMSSRGYKVWMAKFRGEPSCGLVCPLSILSYYSIDNLNTLQEGQDVGELIKCQKYEKDNNIATKLKLGDAMSRFPSDLINITDEENLLSSHLLYKNLKESGSIYVTKKMDGTSATFLEYKNEFMTCSRRLRLKDGDNTWWNIARKYDIENKLKSLNYNIAIQGEIIGPSINKNRVGFKELELRIFTAKNLENGIYLNFYELINLCKHLDLPMVSIIGVYTEIPSIEELQLLTNSLVYNKNKKPAEGIVIRSVNYHSFPLSAKLLNQNYKD